MFFRWKSFGFPYDFVTIWGKEKAAAICQDIKFHHLCEPILLPLFLLDLQVFSTPETDIQLQNLQIPPTFSSPFSGEAAFGFRDVDYILEAA